jgi:hypothetical protein
MSRNCYLQPLYRPRWERRGYGIRAKRRAEIEDNIKKALAQYSRVREVVAEPNNN